MSLSPENKTTYAELIGRRMCVPSPSGASIPISEGELNALLNAARAQGRASTDGVIEAQNAQIRSLTNLATELADQVRAQGHAEGWRPMDSAPKDGTSILIDDRYQGVVIGWWETGREFTGSDHFNDWCSGHNTAGGHDAGFERIYQPLGWFPLPSPPSSTEGA